MGVVDRARKRIPATGDYLDKDELVRAQDEPFGIANVAFDEHGSSFGPRWVLTVIPWFDDQDGPEGLLTFGSNPTRNPMFEDFQAQIEENQNQPIGPVTLIKDKSQKGYRFYTLTDWVEASDEQAQGVPQTPAPKAARPPRSAAAEKPTEVKPAEVPANDAAPKKRVGRPRKDSATATSSATESPSAPSSAPSTATPAAATNAKPAATAIDPAVQQVTLSVGKAICPECHQEVTGRVLPDDTGKRFIIHPHCPATGKAGVVEVTEEV